MFTLLDIAVDPVTEFLSSDSWWIILLPVAAAAILAGIIYGKRKQG